MVPAMLQPQSPTARAQRHRDRRRRGAVVVPLEIEREAAVALANFGIINEGEIADRAKLKEAIELLLFCLGEGTVELAFVGD